MEDVAVTVQAVLITVLVVLVHRNYCVVVVLRKTVQTEPRLLSVNPKDWDNIPPAPPILSNRWGILLHFLQYYSLLFMLIYVIIINVQIAKFYLQRKEISLCPNKFVLVRSVWTLTIVLMPALTLPAKADASNARPIVPAVQDLLWASVTSAESHSALTARLNTLLLVVVPKTIKYLPPPLKEAGHSF